MSHWTDENATPGPSRYPRLEWERPGNREGDAPPAPPVYAREPCRDRCQSERSPARTWMCGRPLGHTGRHAAYSFTHIVAVWKREVAARP